MKGAAGWLLLGCALRDVSLSGQMLVVDRGMSSAAPSSVHVGRTHGAGFVADHFQVGKAGEIWIIDAIRTWSGVEEILSNSFEKVTPLGGIEATAPRSGQPPQPDCDYHNLMIIQSAGWRTGSREIDFQNFHGSVPGGVDIQFGVMGLARSADHIWFSQAASVGGTHQLKIFDEKGRLDGPYLPEGAPLDSGTGLFVKVWGHKMAPVTIRPATETIEVVLRSDGSFDAAKADLCKRTVRAEGCRTGKEPGRAGRQPDGGDPRISQGGPGK